jgi:hypothetical protein
MFTTNGGKKDPKRFKLEVEKKIEKAAAYVHRHVISKNKKMMNN